MGQKFIQLVHFPIIHLNNYSVHNFIEYYEFNQLFQFLITHLKVCIQFNIFIIN